MTNTLIKKCFSYSYVEIVSSTQEVMFSPLSRLVGCLGEGQGMGQETTHSIEEQIRTKGADPGFFHHFSSLPKL